ncbi:jg25646, partial [Pararge aegeria aegeria]
SRRTFRIKRLSGSGAAAPAVNQPRGGFMARPRPPRPADRWAAPRCRSAGTLAWLMLIPLEIEDDERYTAYLDGLMALREENTSGLRASMRGRLAAYSGPLETMTTCRECYEREVRESSHVIGRSGYGLE